MNTGSSIYLPADLKTLLISAAEAEGFEISRGRSSALARFVRELLGRHKGTSNIEDLSIDSFVPSMRSVLHTFSQLDSSQQHRLATVFADILAIAQDQKNSANER